MVSARLPGGESLALSTQDNAEGGSQLRAAQLMDRAQLAPFFAAPKIIAALITAGHVIDKWQHTRRFVWVVAGVAAIFAAWLGA